jgi:hypothetical protein
VPRPATQQHTERGGQRHDRHGAAHQHASKHRRSAPLVAGGAIAAVLVALALIHFLTGKSAPPASRHQVTAGPVSDRAPLASKSASPGVTTPAALAGHWSGHVRQQPNDLVAVSLTLTSGAGTGSVTYTTTGAGCTATLSLTTVTTQTLTFNQSANTGQCSTGTVTLTHTGAETVYFTFHGGGPTAAGTLTKSS